MAWDGWRSLQFSSDDDNEPSMRVIEDHGGPDQLFEELAAPDALESAHRQLNPTAAELAPTSSGSGSRRGSGT